jgi:uncharacterized phage-associated protein
MTTPAKTVAKFIVQNSSQVSNLKLQKLLYYVQGWHLGLHGTIVFPERIEAWVHGPVVPDVFFHFRHFRWTPIQIEADEVKVDEAIENHIREVLKVYAPLSASQLEMISHMESPWKQARGHLSPEETSHAVITPESMKAYFRKRAHGEEA